MNAWIILGLVFGGMCLFSAGVLLGGLLAISKRADKMSLGHIDPEREKWPNFV